MKRTLHLLTVLCLVVIQACHQEPYLSVSPDSLSFPEAGGSQTVQISANYAWSASVTGSGFSVSPSSGEGDATVTVTASAASSTEESVGTLKVVSEGLFASVSIRQDEKKTITLGDAVKVSAEGGSIEVSIQYNTDFTVEVEPSAQSWLKFIKTKSLSSGALQFEVSPNEGPERSGKVTVKDNAGKLAPVSVTIIQQAEQKVISVGDAATVSEEGGTIEVDVSYNVDYDVEVEESAKSWIHFVETKAMTSGKLIFKIDPNESTETRSGKVTLTDKSGQAAPASVTINQERKTLLTVGEPTTVPYCGGSVFIPVEYNTEYTVEVEESAQSWISIIRTKAVSSGQIELYVYENQGEERTGRITVTDLSGKVDPITLTLVQEGPAWIAAERSALVAIYNALGGDNWERNDNWCSDRPVDEWYGVSTDNGHVCTIDLHNNITGRIPPEIGDLTELTWLSISNWIRPDNKDYGPIPSEIGKLKKLQSLSLQGFTLGGKIPESLYDLSNLWQLIIERPGHLDEQQISPSVGKLQNLKRCILRSMNLTGNLTPEFGLLFNLTDLSLQGNNLSGSVPSEWGGMTNIESCELIGNRLSGPLPQSLRLLKNYPRIWGEMVAINFFSEDDIVKSDIPAPDSPLIKTLSGSMLDIDEVYNNNKYTVLYSLDPQSGLAAETVGRLKTLLDLSSPGELGIVTYFENNSVEGPERDERDAAFKGLLSDVSATWPSFIHYFNDDYPDGHPFYGRRYYNAAPAGIDNEITVIGPAKSVEYVSFLTNGQGNAHEMEKTINWLSEKLGTTITHYESTDYSKDGMVTTLRKATVGHGIDIVITGDAFSDRLIADGTLSNMAERAVSDLFAVEPFRSLSDRFNVYLVNAVSKNEEYFNGCNTAFSGKFGAGTAVGGDDGKVLQYVRKAISEDRMDNVLVLVLMNSLRDCGTCYYMNPEDTSIYAGGAAVAWVPFGLSSGVTSKGNLLVHELGGHGMGKLADEYYYNDNGAISPGEVSAIKEKQKGYWFMNVDFTGDASQVLWKQFVKDSRYADEELGAYAGGMTYPTGVWRPSMWSVMNQHHVYGTFNAPSRAQIYTRIMKLSEGQDWNFDYEAFVEWDKAHPDKKGKAAGIAESTAEATENFAPVFIGKTWRQVMKR